MTLSTRLKHIRLITVTTLLVMIPERLFRYRIQDTVKKWKNYPGKVFLGVSIRPLLPEYKSYRSMDKILVNLLDYESDDHNHHLRNVV